MASVTGGPQLHGFDVPAVGIHRLPQCAREDAQRSNDTEIL